MAHTHAPAPSTSINPAAHQRRLIATLTVTGSVFLIEVVSAVLTGSLALLVDAGHMLTDMSVLAASTITAILMRRKPSNTRTWGWARLEVLTAAAGAVVLLVVGIYALMEAGMRLFGGSKAEIDDIGLLLFVGILGLAANIISGNRISGIAFAGTSIIIVVGVALETAREIEAQMTMRHYKGFLE